MDGSWLKSPFLFSTLKKWVKASYGIHRMQGYNLASPQIGFGHFGFQWLYRLLQNQYCEKSKQFLVQ
jgi:hypothetical protein